MAILREKKQGTAIRASLHGRESVSTKHPLLIIMSRVAGVIVGYVGPQYVNITEWKVPPGERITPSSSPSG
jgi:hypothetical protein